MECSTAWIFSRAGCSCRQHPACIADIKIFGWFCAAHAAGFTSQAELRKTTRHLFQEGQSVPWELASLCLRAFQIGIFAWSCCWQKAEGRQQDARSGLCSCSCWHVRQASLCRQVNTMILRLNNPAIMLARLQHSWIIMDNALQGLADCCAAAHGILARAWLYTGQGILQSTAAS